MSREFKNKLCVDYSLLCLVCGSFYLLLVMSYYCHLKRNLDVRLFTSSALGDRLTCYNLGLSSSPKNFPESKVFLYLTGSNISHITERINRTSFSGSVVFG